MCGIFSMEGSQDAANFAYLGLYALQHRGQESAGIAAAGSGGIHVEQGMGQVADIFDQATLARLPGIRAVGHTRYSTSGPSALENAQPIKVRTSMGEMAIVHNGNLTNALELRAELEAQGAIFQTTSDTEVILHLMARDPQPKVIDSLLAALRRVEGAYSLLLISEKALFAARDPHGFRPLVMGKSADGWCFSSETCAFDLLDAETVRHVDAGEVIRVEGDAIESFSIALNDRPTPCAFEQVYFGRPDSKVNGHSIGDARLRMGASLARESPVEADVVVAVPDSGLFAAMGYAREAGIPLEFGLIRNHYVGRTFIEPRQSIRHFGVKVKLNPVRPLIEGRRVVLVDDSIVRGTTSPKIVKMLRDAGAAEVHMRISCPPTTHPCYYGINMPTKEELIASSRSVEEIREFIDADSLAYLSLGGLFEALGTDSVCAACWTGNYPISPRDRSGSQKGLFADEAGA